MVWTFFDFTNIYIKSKVSKLQGERALEISEAAFLLLLRLSSSGRG